MRRACMVFIALITFLFFLASCSQQNQETSTQPPQNTPQTSQNANNQPSIYYPGKIILEVGNDFTRKNQYIYGGIVSNSIVIHVTFNKNTNSAHAISLYFPAHKGTIITLPGTKRQFVVDYVDWQKGTIKMH